MKRFIPLTLILVLIVIIYLSGVLDYFTFENLKHHRELLKQLVGDHPYLCAATYVAVYIIVTTLALPIDLVITVYGGFLFPQPWAAILVVIGAFIGANILFLVARGPLHDLLLNYAGPYLQKFKDGFHRDAAHYMLFLRLVPLFPFWLVNIVPAFLGIPFFTYAWTTFVGIIPAVCVFTQAGEGVGSILDDGMALTVTSILTMDVKIALIGLGFLALLPLAVKWFSKRSMN